MELSGDRGCQCKQAAHGKASESATLVKLAEDRHHTLDVSEAVEGNGGVPFYRALLELLAALKCAVCEISITMVMVGRTGDDLRVVELETCDVLAAPKTKPQGRWKLQIRSWRWRQSSREEDSGAEAKKGGDVRPTFSRPPSLSSSSWVMSETCGD
jgi:hypothetical protein